MSTIVTNLNDRWSRIAQLTVEKPARPPQPINLNGAPPVRESALAVAGLTPAEVKKLAAKFSNAPVKPTDKDGIAATAAGNVVSVWIPITPDMAARWLKSNLVNRPLSDDVATAYARDMTNGVWRATHQGIAFNDRDELIDGQHRLVAVVKAQKTIRMMVTFGLPAKIEGSEMTTMDCVDRGRPRSVADQLKIQHGLAEGGQIASVCAALGHLCFGERLRRLSVGQTLDIYRAFQPGVDYVIKHRSKNGGLKSAGVLAAFAFAHAIKGAEVPRRLAVLNTAVEIEGSPMLKLLREFLISNESLVTMRNLHRGIVELVAHVLWTDMFQGGAGHSRPATLEMNPEEWLKGVEYFREQQRPAVAKIAALFQLPEAK